MKLEEIKENAQILGIIPREIVTIVSVKPVGNDAMTVVYRDSSNRLSEQMVYRDQESMLTLAEAGLAWSFDSPSEDFRLVLEAQRIQLGYLFDPMMAIHTSNIEPLPHQISAVYEAMLPKQPLRFVLADDPGAGKTVMAGLLIKELIMRSDVQRVLIVAPGALTEQWQDEMREKFSLQFQIFSREQQERSLSGNYFADEDLVIARMDQLARAEDIQNKLRLTHWDLVVIDEAHKLSAPHFGNKINKTKRYLLGELLGSGARHLLMMTATPHNGKDEDFQLWLALLDSDRFYGENRESVRLDVSDVMRRMVKEDLLKFDGTRLFPERRAYTVNYQLSDAETLLYHDVTNYVVSEMNRAERLNGQKKNRVGFALTMLQRRLASSPEAIYQSLHHRRERLESKCREQSLNVRGESLREERQMPPQGNISTDAAQAHYFREQMVELPDNMDEIEDDFCSEAYEETVDMVVNQLTAAETVVELKKEIDSLKALEEQAHAVLESGEDCKWKKLSEVLQEFPEMYNAAKGRRKLIIFTEHKDTLNYLQNKIAGVLGNPNAIRMIYGGTNRDLRRKIQEEFRNDPEVLVLIATDAAGEGVNLQNANLMINYDLPWNPNRLEQRFGRIHRIGQTETCHLWNMVAKETREGEVFHTLFEKLEKERLALGGRVFDILGDAFEGTSLKELLIKAIREGEQPEARRWMTEKVEEALDTDRLKEIIRRNSLVDQTMTTDMLYKVKEEMDKAQARKLQPCFVQAFFQAAFKSVGGDLRPREKGRYEISNVPLCIRENDRVAGQSRKPITRKYARICFEKSHIRPGLNMAYAEFIHPGHPLMYSLTDQILYMKRSLLKPGTVMIDPVDEGVVPSLIFMIDHSVREAIGEKQVSRRLHFVRMTPDAEAHHAGWAPHLDLINATPEAQTLAAEIRAQSWIAQELEERAVAYASEHLAREHFDEINRRRNDQVTKIQAAVRARLVPIINEYSNRAIKMDEEVAAGRQPQVQSINLRKTAQELTERYEHREAELGQMKNLISNTPVALGGILVIPQGLLNQRSGIGTYSVDPAARSRIEQLAMEAVMRKERSFGHTVIDVSGEKCGWDVTARIPRTDEKQPMKEDRHIEVKGRVKGADKITVTRNEICYAVNQREKFILAIVLIDGETVEGPYYIKNPFLHEPDFAVLSHDYNLSELLSRAVKPEETL